MCEDFKFNILKAEHWLLSAFVLQFAIYYQTI